MYFWKIESLKGELTQKGLSQNNLFKYIFIYVFLLNLLVEITGYIDLEGMGPNNIDYALSVVWMLFVSFGTYFCYTVNGGANGSNFAERYFSIGLVVFIRSLAILVVMMLIMFVMVFGVNSLEDADNLPTKWPDAVVWISWMTYLYSQTIYHINQVAKRINA